MVFHKMLTTMCAKLTKNTRFRMFMMCIIEMHGKLSLNPGRKI